MMLSLQSRLPLSPDNWSGDVSCYGGGGVRCSLVSWLLPRAHHQQGPLLLDRALKCSVANSSQEFSANFIKKFDRGGRNYPILLRLKNEVDFISPWSKVN
jgi:hypothetical protein